MDKLEQGLFNSGVPDTSSFGSIGAIVGFIANLVMGLGFAVGIYSIAMSAILYIGSEGDTSKTQKAWQSFLYGLIASAVALGAVAIKDVVLSAIGVSGDILTDQPVF